MTSYTRAVVLFGLFLGAALAQILVSAVNIDYFYLNIIAFVNICIGFLISLFLPMPKKTFFFYAKHSLSSNTTETSVDEDTKTADTEAKLLDKQPTDEDANTVNVTVSNLYNRPTCFLVPRRPHCLMIHVACFFRFTSARFKNIDICKNIFFVYF